MKRNLLQKLTYVLFATLACTMLTACPDDPTPTPGVVDEEESHDEITINKTWVWSNSDGYVAYTFAKDGTVALTLHYFRGLSSLELGTYSYNEKSKSLTMRFGNKSSNLRVTELTVDDLSFDGRGYYASDYYANEVSPSIEMAKLIKSNVSVSSTYRDFGWHLEFNTSLPQAYPTKSFRYGIMCSYDNYYWWGQYAKGNGNSYTLDTSVFVSTDDSPYRNLGIWWEAYWNVMTRKRNGESLRDDERAYIAEHEPLFSAKESEAKSKYMGRAFVEFDRIQYYLYYYNN